MRRIFHTLLDLLNECRSKGRRRRIYQNPVDLLFEELEEQRSGTLCGHVSTANINLRRARLPKAILVSPVEQD